MLGLEVDYEEDEEEWEGECIIILIISVGGFGRVVFFVGFNMNGLFVKILIKRFFFKIFNFFGFVNF